MERSDSVSSTGSRASGHFAYQERLLARAGSISRASSGTPSRTPSILNPQAGTTHRWTPTHRIGHSVDGIRSKTNLWEERARQNAADAVPPSPTRTSRPLPEPQTSHSGHRQSIDAGRPSALPPLPAKDPIPTNKRHTWATNVPLASYLPPADPPRPASPAQPSFSASASNRFKQSSRDYNSSSHSQSSSSTSQPALAHSESLDGHSRTWRMATAATAEVITPTITGSSNASHSSRDEILPTTTESSPDPFPAANPPAYKSAFMLKRRGAAKYGESMTEGRKLGRHLPRIASGDGNDWEERQAENRKHSRSIDTIFQEKGTDHTDIGRRVEERITRVEPREFRPESKRHSMPPLPPTPLSPTISMPGVSTSDAVAGMSNRVRLSAPTAPLPSARFGKLWADEKRHLIQAYEYLCHVGEAQQWIEGCLDEMLPFGVVEMDEGLRNGVVLARLARIWDQASVRKIFDDPKAKLGWRHIDNIYHFLTFVKNVGLPDNFVFETTDLYNKKNIPKVIYCIHALSHLLSRRGMAQRIGNLIGRLEFSDDQLYQTQKGLTAAGVPMPNFKTVGSELAKEINEEVEAEQETEEERRDRMLEEVEDSIIKLQAVARGYLTRTHLATQRAKLRMAERYITKAQARGRGFLVRRDLAAERRKQYHLQPWVIALQAAIRAMLTRQAIRARLARIRSMSRTIIKVQAQARGVLARRRVQFLKVGLRKSSKSVLKFQSIARAKIAKAKHTEIAKTLHHPIVMEGVVAFQASCRGALARRRDRDILRALQKAEPFLIGLQAHATAALTRRRLRTHLQKLDDSVDVVVKIQAAARAFIARKRLLNLIRGLRKATPFVIALQTKARASMVQKARQDLDKALGKVEVIASVQSFQAMAKAALARNRVREQIQRLDTYEVDTVGFQAAARGALVRNEYWAWRDHLHRSQLEAIYLQALCRGIIQRRKFRIKVKHYRANLDKVVKIQSLFRANQQKEQYKQLTLGKNVSVSTIKNFVHLLDDSETDFQEEIEVEELRKKVVEAIRENQQLETDVNELDVKIALVVQNVKSFEEVIKARRKHGADSAAAHAARASILAAHGDPFAGPNTLDKATKRKLELYQQLFYLLQTKGEYLTRLFFHFSRIDLPDKTRRLTERVSLTLFGYGQNIREDYLLLKLFQTSIHEEVRAALSIQDVTEGHPMFINVAFNYVRPKQVTYVKEILSGLIEDIVGQDELDLETDPSAIYRSRINLEEMRTGMASNKQKDVDYRVALEDLETRTEFIHHLQKLVTLTKECIAALTASTRKVPYGLRFMARETLAALRTRFPDEPESAYAAALGRLIYYRYINPAIITPETFDIVPSTIAAQPRKNLGQIALMLNQITSGQPFGYEAPWMFAVEDYMKFAIKQFSDWFLEVADVPDAETHYHANEFLDATVQPKPIYISPNEVYSTHSLLLKNLEVLAPQRDDPLRVILQELDGVPVLPSEDQADELHNARDRAITLELTNRFAVVKDPLAEEKALWVRAKRGVLAILRVQPGKDLVDSIMLPITEDHERLWEEIVDNEMSNDRMRQKSRRMASTAGGNSSYRLDDIRSQSFREVKAHAIFFLLELEKQGKVTRNDGYQGILDAIASDVRSKHRKRMQRQQEKQSMRDALGHLKERRKNYEEQIKSYHDYVEAAMTTMQKGRGPKKRFVMPFTKQYFHLRDLQKSGQTPQFGSFKYSAQDLYSKGILLSIDQISPRQFDRIDVIISSNKMGVFTIEIFNSTVVGAGPTLMASMELRMEDLLQAQFENKVALSLFDGMAKMNLNLLLYQINKKFYV